MRRGAERVVRGVGFAFYRRAANARREVKGNSLACGSINPSVRKRGGSTACGGVFDEQQGKFGNVPVFRVYTFIPFPGNPRFGPIYWRRGRDPIPTACCQNRSKTGGARGWRQGDPDEEFHARGRKSLGGYGNQPGAGAADSGDLGRFAAE